MITGDKAKLHLALLERRYLLSVMGNSSVVSAKRFFPAAVLFCLWLMTVMSMAQTAPRDYTISTPRVSYTADGASAILAFTITNQGGAAAEESQITIADNSTGRVEKSIDLPILAANEVYPFSTELQLASFPEGDVFLQVEVGIDQYELAGSPVARNNSQLFRINIAEARDSGSTLADLPQLPDASKQYDLLIPLINVGINFMNEGLQINGSMLTNTQILFGIGMIVLAIVLLWFLSLILRLIFRRPPNFDTWHPPYDVSSYHDPDSAQGRRQSWQYHAQNSTIAAACIPDQVVVIKRLVDKQGTTLGSWNITGLRTTQFDIYGRINRTEVFMPHKLIKRLNKTAGSALELDNQQLRVALQPLANKLSKAIISPIEKQNRMLPIAMDIRFEARQGDVRVIFELYQCRNETWHLIDQWDPEFGSIGSRIPENFTYTLNGLLPGETFREFKTRLSQDLVQLLGGLLYHHQTAADPDTSESPPERPADESYDDATDSSTANVS